MRELNKEGRLLKQSIEETMQSKAQITENTFIPVLDLFIESENAGRLSIKSGISAKTEMHNAKNVLRRCFNKYNLTFLSQI